MLGSIIGGIATVNQAGAIGAGGALIMAGYRLRDGHKDAFYPAILALASLAIIVFVLANFNTNIKNIRTSADVTGVTIALIGMAGLTVALIWSGWRALKIDNTLQGVMIETAKTTSLVFIILLGAAILTAAFRAFGGEHLVRDFLESLPGGFWTKFVIVMGVIFILGFFLDFIEIAVVVVPIVAPILLSDPSANITAVWLGVMIGLNIQTSFLTPPFGFALFYLRGVAPAIVKTLQIYKGVIPFICLQLVALVIVGMAPQLVNYLPNRVSLLSDTAPPPRNPRLTYCVDQYLTDALDEGRVPLLAAVDTARQLDLSVLPDDIAEATRDSFDQVARAIDLLDDANIAALDIAGAADAYRPMHRQVRDIERDMRDIDERIEELDILADRARDPSQAAQRERYESRMAALEEEKQALAATIPAEWEGVYAAFDELNDAETSLRRDFNRASAAAYEPIAELLASLNAYQAFLDLGDELVAMRDAVASNPPEEMTEPLNQLARQFGEVEGAGDIRSALSAARRALRSRTPDTEEALADVDEALAEYRLQSVWREAADQTLTSSLAAYEATLAPTIGIRQQRRLTREQALFVASCSSDHRDISLSF